MIIKFDDRNVNWSKDAWANKLFIRYNETCFNDVLQFRGYITVMEVFKGLGVAFDIDEWLERPLKDAVWMYEEKGLIDFKPKFNDDGTVLLEFNID